MADFYGLGDISQLSGPDQTTAKNIQRAFMNSMAAGNRQQARYDLPQLANYNEDMALGRATVAANQMNQNQQLQMILDQMNQRPDSPHGVAQNIGAYAPLLGLGNQLATTLFGRSGGGALAEQGLWGVGKQAYNSIFHPGSGSQWTIDQNGNIVGPSGSVVGAGGQAGWPGDTSGMDFSGVSQYAPREDLGGWGSVAPSYVPWEDTSSASDLFNFFG